MKKKYEIPLFEEVKIQSIEEIKNDLSRDIRELFSEDDELIYRCKEKINED